MIQIIKGTFGYYNGRKVIPITEADGPQKFDDELEARLVKEGVAKYIGELGETAEQPAPAPGDDADEPASTNTAADEAPEYNEDMKLDELKEVATRYWAEAGRMLGASDGESDYELLSGGSGTAVVYDLSGLSFSPQIKVEGDTDEDALIRKLRDLEPEFIDFILEALSRREGGAYVTADSRLY